MPIIEVKVPDIGNYSDVPVIELLVKPGEKVKKDQGLVTLESDKATMEVPSPVAGVVKELRVKLGDALAEGHVVAVIETDVSAAAVPPSPPGRGGGGEGATLAKSSEKSHGKSEPSPGATVAPGILPPATLESPFTSRHPLQEPPFGRPLERASPSVSLPLPGPPRTSGREPENQFALKAAPATGRKADFECQVAVLGSGPGGYTAAFRAADLEQSTVLIERYESLGGVCLNVGCIPSKALLHTARVIDEAAHGGELGVEFSKPKIVLDKLRSYKDGVVAKLTGGLAAMAKQRKVTRVTGTGRFVSPHEIEVETSDGIKLVRFEHAIIAAGSQAVKLPGLPWDDSRVMDSTDALLLVDIPKRLLVIGGGIIGLEMACVFDALGSKVTVVEMLDQLMPGADLDLVKPLHQRLAKRYEAIYLKTKVAKVEATKAGLKATFEAVSGSVSAATVEPQVYDRVLCAVGRSPNGKKINAEAAGVVVDERGYVATDRQMRTNVPHIFAIGDLVGQPMLAHKATHEGKVAAEVAAGRKSEFVARVVPSVAYTDPEVAWVGATEIEAKAKGLRYGVGKFPYAASGRAIGINRTEGFTKLLFDEATHRIIGAGITGPNAGDLISEVALAIEMGCEAADIGLTIHPHPTLSESIGMAAEAYEGTITDLYLPKRK